MAFAKETKRFWKNIIRRACRGRATYRCRDTTHIQTDRHTPQTTQVARVVKLGTPPVRYMTKCMSSSSQLELMPIELLVLFTAPVSRCRRTRQVELGLCVTLPKRDVLTG